MERHSRRVKVKQDSCLQALGGYPLIMGMADDELHLRLVPMNFGQIFRPPFMFPYQISANCNFFLWWILIMARFIHILIIISAIKSHGEFGSLRGGMEQRSARALPFH